jgi:hypothetical protein
MSKTTSTTGSLKKSLVRIAALVVLLIGGAYLYLTNPWSVESQHQRVRHRVDTYFRTAQNSMSYNDRELARLTPAERGRYEIIRAIFTSLGNWPFAYRRDVVPEKFAAIADRLDADGGADLKTFEGCCALLVLCNEASSSFHDYPWITRLYEMEEDKTIPPLPKLKHPPGT